MGGRVYLRDLTQLSKPLIATIVLGALAAVVVVTGASLSVIWDVDTDVLSPVFGVLFAATVACAGAELVRSERKWVRAVGYLVVTAVVITVVLILLTLWFLSLLCRNGCN